MSGHYRSVRSQRDRIGPPPGGRPRADTWSRPFPRVPWLGGYRDEVIAPARWREELVGLGLTGDEARAYLALLARDHYAAAGSRAGLITMGYGERPERLLSQPG